MIRPSLAAVLLASVSLAACGAPDPETQTGAPATTDTAPSGATGALSTQSIEAAVWQATPATPSAPTPPTAQPTAPGADPAVVAAPTPPRPEIIRAQILLDRARFSPGAIDGLGGENTRQAIAAFEEANGLPSDGELDARVFARLTENAAPVMTRYVITAADVAGPFRPVPTSLEDQAALPAL
ncbi:MAG: peptidoglycan-binding domain-containing protein, partial [Phenylobacterium sp.]|nr:peptidoglycan-binding domain-containing protein [Phenylobacterium sp.]